MTTHTTVVDYVIASSKLLAEIDWKLATETLSITDRTGLVNARRDVKDSMKVFITTQPYE
jgi:hypothetical protein